jgi:hypothetical protein
MKKLSKSRKHETTADFKARIAAAIRQRNGEDADPYASAQRRAPRWALRPRGSAPTPSEMLGGAKMPKLGKPPKAIADWLRSVGVKL